MILRTKVVHLEKGLLLPNLNKGDKHSYYPNLILVLVAVILTFEGYLLIIKVLGAHKT